MNKNEESVSLMLATLEGSPLLDKMGTEWETLAKELCLPFECIENIRTGALFSSENSEKIRYLILSDILLNWRLRSGPKANFTAFIKIIEERCGWISIGDQLKKIKEACIAEINKETKWKELSPCKQCELCTKEVHIFGVKRPLMGFTRGISEFVLRTILEDTLNKEDLCQFVNSADYELARDTTPDILPYYVEREVFLKNKININNILTNNTDVFAVEGIDKQTLEIVTRSQVEFSSNQIHNISCRFILLEERSHFEQLCQVATSTIHYVKFQMGNYFWVETSGNDENLLKFRENPVSMNEDSFIKIHLANHSSCIICISGVSGDGKTTFLANIARKIQKVYSERVVIFTNFQYILANVHYGQELSIGQLIHILTSYVSPNELGRKIISEVIFNPNYQTELFLDGYDELLSSERDLAMQILTCLAKELKFSRIFVTANESQYKELEHHFDCVTWAMKDFQKKDQVKLLNLYWAHFKKMEITSDLSIFAEKCVSLLACSKSLQNFQHVGTPMLSVVLAQQFGNLVRGFLRGDFKTFDNQKNHVTSIALYKDFFKGIFENMSIKTKKKLIQLALLKAFPQIFNNVFLEERSTDSDFSYELHNNGLLQISSNSNTIEFVHKSFTDFLLIECLLNEMETFDVEMGIPIYNRILSFLLQTTTNLENRVTFVNLHLCLIFEAFLLDQSEFRKETARLVFEQVSGLGKNFNRIFLACLNNEIYGVLCLILQGVQKHAQYLITESPCLSKISHDKLLRILDVTSRYINIKAAKKIHKSLEISKTELCAIQLNKCDHFGIKITSLHFAAKQGNAKLFDYFEDSSQQLPKFLCHVTVYNSKYDLPHVVEGKIEIIKKLVKITYSQILQETSQNIPPVHLLKNIHVRLLRCLIESGVDLFATDSQQNTLAHQIADYMEPDEYHDIVEILLSLEASSIFCKSNRNEETAFSKVLRIMKLEDKTINLLLTSQKFKSETKTNPEDTCVYQLIKAGYGIEVLGTALENSSAWNQGFCENKTTSLLHIAVLYQNIEAVKYFLDVMQISVNATDDSGMTPYHVACSEEFLYFGDNGCNEKCVKILRILLEHGANVRLTDNSGKIPLYYLLRERRLTNAV